MTLRVTLRAPGSVGEACRLVRTALRRRLAPLRDLPASTGMFSLLPRTAWTGRCVANCRGDEVRCLVEARGTAIRLRSDTAWTAGVYGVTAPVDLRRARPTWEYRDPRRRVRWARPGAGGSDDAVFLARLEFAPATPEALLAVPDGIKVLMVRRLDRGPEAPGLLAETMVNAADRPGVG